MSGIEFGVQNTLSEHLNQVNEYPAVEFLIASQDPDTVLIGRNTVDTVKA